MMDWAVQQRNASQHLLPPLRRSAEGGMVRNDFTIRGDTAYVELPNGCTNFHDTATVAIDAADLPTMDAATDAFWLYDAPGHLPRGAYLPRSHRTEAVDLARLLLDAPRGAYRLFKDGDALNCRRGNLALQNHPPLQSEWLWNAPLPAGFTVIEKMENAISVTAEPGTNPSLMWSYLLERWQFCRSKGIHIVPPRVNHEFVERCRITALVHCGVQIYSFDMGDDGVRENREYDIYETARAA